MIRGWRLRRRSDMTFTEKITFIDKHASLGMAGGNRPATPGSSLTGDSASHQHKRWGTG